MAGSIGVNNLRGLTLPNGAHAQTSSGKANRPVVQTKNAQGVTVFIDQMTHEENTVSVAFVGDSALALAVASNVAAGTVQITGAEFSHKLGERPKGTIEARKFINDEPEE